jgi:DNA-binding MurR/RpiR family transcriptional regulator
MSFPNLPVIKRIKDNYSKLTTTSKKIADFITENPQKVLKMSITDLAEAAGVKSESSVVRFYRKLDFNGYHEFKVSLAGEISGASILHTYEDVLINDTISEVKRKIISSSISAFQNAITTLDENSLSKTLDILDNSRNIICLGHGASASVANYAAFRLSLLGKSAFFIPDSHTYAIILSKLKKEDCVFTVSYSGETRDFVIPFQKRNEKYKIITITGSKGSFLARISDQVILSNVEETAMRTDAMISRHVQLAIVDILFAALAIKDGKDSLNTLSDSRNSLAHLKF